MGLQKTFLAIAIAAIFATFMAYGVNVFYEKPKYDFSENDCYRKYDCYKPIRECENQYAQNQTPEKPILVPGPNDCYINITRTPEYKTCLIELDECNEEYTKTSPQYKQARNTFFILLFIGLAAIICGSLIRHLEGVGSGFIGGGALLILWSIIQSGVYVYHLDRYIKLAGLGIVLVVLIYVGAYKIDTKGKKK